MKKFVYGIFMLLLSFVAYPGNPADIPGIVPKPQKMEVKPGTFQLTSKTIIYWNNDEASQIAGQLNDFLKSAFDIQLVTKQSKREKNGINIVADKQYANEEYSLSVQKGTITIKGSSSGIFYGLQTLLQLMPSDETSAILIPQLEIQDKPRFSYRGSMLDVGRYFFPVDYIKKFIDLIAYYKINTLHMHLTEDGGWRVEIKKYPQLTKIGAWRRSTQDTRIEPSDKLPNGGYYTQKQLKELVAYAQKKNVTIIPEIDMPGHALATLASYPELSCTGGPFKVLEQWSIQKDVLCAGNEATYKFVEDVLDELMDIFPSPIIHCGGDEAPKDRWNVCPKCQAKIKQENLKDANELQSYFINRIATYLESKGRRLIGWDEILEGGLAPNAMVMSWRGEEGGIAAAQQKHEVVMSPSTYLYLDYYQGKSENEPDNIGGNLTLEKVYSYEPFTNQIPAEYHKYIVGVQGNIWMEYIHSVAKLEYMGFPRLLALAEIGWSEKGKDYSDFTNRLKSNLQWLDKRDVNFRIPEPCGLKDTKVNGNSVIVNLEPPVKGATIYYTVNGEDPMLNGIPYTSPVEIKLSDAPVTLKCIVRTEKGRVSGTYSATYSN